MSKVHEGPITGRAAKATAWSTAITATTESRVLIRGLALDEAIGRISFAEMLLRLWSGEPPRTAQIELLEACLVAAIDHGPLAPSALVARTIASTRAAPMSALAGGILSFGELHGAVVTRAMHLLGTIPPDGDLDAWADATFRSERDARRRLPGIGHRWHTQDLRAERLLAVASTMSDGRREAAVRALAARVSRHVDREVPVNIDGALAVALDAIGLDPDYGDLLFAIARSFGLAAHIVEERARELPMRLIDPTAASYDGIPASDAIQEVDR
ncbi:MAG: citrate/2-methylcitrate synthase [Candidatus Limnocylindrales bacterium]